MSDQETSDPLALQHFQGTQGFGFSAVSIGALDADEYTLVSLAVDASGSIGNFTQEIIDCVKEVVASCQSSPRADNLLLRVTIFGNGVQEVHGYTPLAQITTDQYDTMLDRLGTTPLHDAIVDMCSATNQHAKTLFDEDYNSNGIGIVITDGHHYNGRCSIGDASDAMAAVLGHEHLESWNTILIGVNVDTASQTNAELSKMVAACNFAQYESVADADAKTLSRIAGFVSKSISSASTALGTGGPSKSLTF